MTLRQKATTILTLAAMLLSGAGAATGAQVCQQMTGAAHHGSSHHGSQQAPANPAQDCPHAALGSSCVQVSLVSSAPTVLATPETSFTFVSVTAVLAHTALAAPIFHPPRV